MVVEKKKEHKRGLTPGLQLRFQSAVKVHFWKKKKGFQLQRTCRRSYSGELWGAWGLHLTKEKVIRYNIFCVRFPYM